MDSWCAIAGKKKGGKGGEKRKGRKNEVKRGVSSLNELSNSCRGDGARKSNNKVGLIAN